MSKINRNDPCPCGSGKKYKKCCGAKESHGRKIRIGGGAPLSKGIMPMQAPSLDLAQRVFKVLSSAGKPKNDSGKPVEPPPSSLRGYGSLEELIGVEGAPKPVVMPEANQE